MFNPKISVFRSLFNSKETPFTLEAIQADGRVHGKVITNGAVTGRMTHHSPNMAQVPNSSAIYGLECRDLWIVEKGCKLVGIDASGGLV